jgi:hypothetical protein
VAILVSATASVVASVSGWPFVLGVVGVCPSAQVEFKSGYSSNFTVFYGRYIAAYRSGI